VGVGKLNSGRTGRTGHSEGRSDACVFFADADSFPAGAVKASRVSSVSSPRENSPLRLISVRYGALFLTNGAPRAGY